jgi:hypothetical protein
MTLQTFVQGETLTADSLNAALLAAATADLSPDQITAAIIVHYQGTYNAATNTIGGTGAGLSNGGGGGASKGFAYIVTTAGTVSADGVGAVAVMDAIVSNGTTWQRWPASSIYGSMALQNAGAVSITGGTAELSELAVNDLTVAEGASGYSLVFDDGLGDIAAGFKQDGTFQISRLQSGDSFHSALTWMLPYARAWDDGANLALAIDANGNLVGNVRPGRRLRDLVTASVAQQLLKPGFKHTFKLKDSFMGSATSGQTWRTLLALETEIEAVRFGIPYDQQAACQVIGSFAPTAKPGISPVDGSNNPVAWTQITWNNGGLDVDYWQQLQAAPAPAPNAGPFSLIQTPVLETASGGPYNGKQAITWSDWMPFDTMVRSDGGSFPLMLYQFYVTGTPRPSPSPDASFDNINGGRLMRSYVNTGDCVTTPANFTSTTLVTQTIAPIVQFITRKRGVTVMMVADSVGEGYTTNNNCNNFAAQAVRALSSPQLPLFHLNGGFWGMGYPDYFWNAHNILAASKPEVVVIQAMSRNKGNQVFTNYDSVADQMQVFRNALLLAQRVKEYGGVPVLFTLYGESSETAQTDAIRVQVLQMIEKAAASGILVVNTDPLLSVGSNPATINPGYTYDNLHPSDLGHSLLDVAAFRPLLQQVIGE